MRKPPKHPVTCDTCGEPVGDYTQHALDGDFCRDSCVQAEINRREKKR